MKKLVGTHEWQRYDLTVHSDRGPLNVSWSDVLELARWHNMQAGLYIKGPKNTLQLFFENFPKWNQDFWVGRHKFGTFDLPNNAKIVDVGCGVAVVDMLLASYLPESTFCLIDANESTWGPSVYYTKDYPVYNSWAPIEDAIATTGFDRKRFTIQGPGTQFPEDVDCITSYFSWCFHYPKDTYWEQAYGSLKKGGKLVLDVRLLNDRDTIGEITEQMKCEPIKFPYPNMSDTFDAYQSPDPYVMGYRCTWTKK